MTSRNEKNQIQKKPGHEKLSKKELKKLRRKHPAWTVPVYYGLFVLLPGYIYV